MTAGQTVDSGHDRVKLRRLTAGPVSVGYRDWPALAQVVNIERHVTSKPSRAQRHGVVSEDTSFGRERAGPGQGLGLVRQPWLIATKSHGVREVTRDEGRSHVRYGSVPQVMAPFRDTATGLTRWSGEAIIAAACRRSVAQPWPACTPVGIVPAN